VADGTASTDVATVNQISNPTITGGTIDGAPIGAANPKNGRFLALSATSAALTGVCTATTVTPGTDNSTKIATTAFVQSAISAVASGVTSFNTRSGAVTLLSADVTTALGYTPYNASGATVITTSNISSYAPTVSGSGAYGTWGISISGNAATVTGGVYTTGAQSIAGSKTFTDTMYIGSGTTTPIVQTSSGVLSLGANLVSSASYTVPQNDGVANLGFSGLRWAQVYAANGTINTSDANAKQQIADFTVAEIAVGKRLRGLFKTYKMNEAVERKGANARIHAGVMAQAVFDAFAAEGLDANKYSLYCVDTWIDKDGATQTACGIRYDELYAFILGSL
jgi:hypothetical protein